jgi:hypothetical protein
MPSIIPMPTNCRILSYRTIHVTISSSTQRSIQRYFSRTTNISDSMNDPGSLTASPEEESRRGYAEHDRGDDPATLKWGCYKAERTGTMCDGM